MESCGNGRAAPTPDGMKRRDFLKTLAAAAVGLPAAGALLTGCDGDGDGQPDGNLGEALAEAATELQRVREQMAQSQAPDMQALNGWIGDVNADVNATWPLMVAADTPTLRGLVPQDMQQILQNLDGAGATLEFSGPAPTITVQQLADAWTRSSDLIQTRADTKAAAASRENWIFFAMLFLLFPTWTETPNIAMGYAQAAQSMDTGGHAASLYDLLHQESVSCTPCFFSALVASLTAIHTLLFMALGSMAAHSASMLYGTDWVLVMVMMMAISMIFIASST